MVAGPGLTDALCTRCGLCCDGSLFADVELAGRAEVTRLEAMGLDVDEDSAEGALLPLPCAALRGRRCSIYPHRPGCCRTFECRLLQDARRGTVSVERAAAHISETLRLVRRVRSLLARLGAPDVRLPLAERCAEALASGAASGPLAERRRAELRAARSALERSIRTRFLGP